MPVELLGQTGNFILLNWLIKHRRELNVNEVSMHCAEANTSVTSTGNKAKFPG